MVGRLLKGYPDRDTVSIIKIPCQGRDRGSNPRGGAKFRILTAKSFMTRWFDSNICRSGEYKNYPVDFKYQLTYTTNIEVLGSVQQLTCFAYNKQS